MSEYKLKISNAVEEDGSIDLQRLAELSKRLHDIAKGALNIRLHGVSHLKGRRNRKLQQALKISLSQIERGSTVLSLKADSFGETLDEDQLAIGPELLKDQTPLSLVVHSFRDAMEAGSEAEFLDKALLKDLVEFKRVFSNPRESISLSNNGQFPDLFLTPEKFEQIKVKEEALPDPHAALVNGKVETLEHSSKKVIIDTPEGKVEGFLAQEIKPEEISEFWGKEVTLKGMLHYRSKDKTILEIEQVFEPGTGDSYFSRKPVLGTVEEQIQTYMSRKKRGNPLGEIVDQWPGDETFEEIMDALQ